MLNAATAAVLYGSGIASATARLDSRVGFHAVTTRFGGRVAVLLSGTTSSGRPGWRRMS